MLLLLPPLPFPFYSMLLLHSIMVFSFVCRYSPTRSAILVYPLYIRPSTSVLCRSSPSWPLLLFASCVFALNKSFCNTPVYSQGYYGNLKWKDSMDNTELY
jgi:hypothetical protein